MAETSNDQPLSYATPQEWQAEAARRFGADPMLWRFVCPACGHIASVQDWKDAGAPEGAVAFSCVGRYLPGPVPDAFTDGTITGPCSYAGGGLFRLNPVRVVDGERTHEAFAFAESEEAPR